MQRNPLKFYLASSFESSHRVDHISFFIESRGHAVPVKWWEHYSTHEAKDEPITDDEFYSREDIQLAAARDFAGITTCDVFVFIASNKPRKYNGANVELGYALALGKPCFVVGTLERSAMYAHVRRATSVHEILEACNEKHL